MAIINSYPTATPKNSDLLIGTQVYDASDPSSPDENVTKSFTAKNIANLAFNYTTYVIGLTQSGTDAPVITEFENNTGLTFTWTRAAAGVYDGTPDSSLTTSETWVQVTGGTDSATTLHLKSINPTEIRLTNLSLDGSATPQDNLDNGYLELRIYS